MSAHYDRIRATAISFAIALTGCSGDAGSNATTSGAVHEDVSRPDQRPAAGQIRIDLTANAAAETTVTTSPGANIVVAGEFELEDKSKPAPPLVAQIARDRGGKLVIMNTHTIKPKKVGGVASFEGDIAAPKKIGSYRLEVVKGTKPNTVIGHSGLVVAPTPPKPTE